MLQNHYNIFMTIHLGCPVWSFKGWVGNFYPKGAKPSDFLREYARHLTAIEGNTTFYAAPAPKTIEDWVTATPGTFRFCPKIPKAVSHEGTLKENLPGALQFVGLLRGLGIRLGPMFLQLPPRFSPKQIDDLRTFLDGWPQDLRLAVEVRHLSWFDAPHDARLNELLTEHKMARVTIDTRPIRDLAGDAILAGSSYENLLEARERKPDVPVIPQRTADFVFVRYIGHPRLETNLSLLDEWSQYFATQMKMGADVYTFCHSPDNLIAPEICRELHRRVDAQLPIPPLPWDTLAPDAAPLQPSLF
jgi:uncharacterized protein YecE (DUF72 family)